MENKGYIDRYHNGNLSGTWTIEVNERVAYTDAKHPSSFVLDVCEHCTSKYVEFIDGEEGRNGYTEYYKCEECGKESIVNYIYNS